MSLYSKHKKTYHIWYSMLWRCKQTSGHFYKYYGSRGITVCKRWQKFENFLADMGNKPEGKSLDRIDNDGNYSPKNCRWATNLEQGLNKRNVHLVTAGGMTHSVGEWARILGVKQPTASQIIKRGTLEKRVKSLQVLE